MNVTSHAPALLLVALLMAACGRGGGRGDAAAGGEAATLPADTAIRPLERHPLTEADLAGLEPDRIVVELPWTANRVARDPGSSPRGYLLEAVTSGYDGFDRAAFRFADVAGVPGYEIEMRETGRGVACAGREVAVGPPEGRILIVRFLPARGTDYEGRRTVQVRTADAGLERFGEAGLACDEGDQATWVAALAAGSQVRVLQLGKPPRLVVDVR